MLVGRVVAGDILSIAGEERWIGENGKGEGGWFAREKSLMEMC